MAAECPVCFGEGHHDMTDSDAWFGEQFTDAQLDAMRERGLVHPVGIVECDECEGTGVVTEERAAEIRAWARASVEQTIAEYNRREGIAPKGDPR